MLTTICQHCGQAEQDGFEVLEEGVLHECKCEACSKVYSLFFVDCHCGHETVASWQDPPTRETLSKLACESCMSPLLKAEELSEESP